MDAIKRIVYLESVSMKSLKTPCKIVGYVNMILFGCAALLLHIQGIVLLLARVGWHPRSLLYVTKEVEESWMVCRAVFGYFFIKGVREENPAYVLPIVIDASTQLLASFIFLALHPFSSNYYELGLSRIVVVILSFIMDNLILTLAGNYFRRLRRGNLQAESEQQDA